jgi:hypothetical protein
MQTYFDITFFTARVRFEAEKDGTTVDNQAP